MSDKLKSALLKTMHGHVHSLFYPPQIGEHTIKISGGALKPDQFNKTFNHWNKHLTQLLLSTQLADDPKYTQLVVNLLTVKFIPHMEAYMREGFDAARNFPLVAENAFKFIEVVGNILPNYVAPKDITGRYLQGKMLAPSKDAWLATHGL